MTRLRFSSYAAASRGRMTDDGELTEDGGQRSEVGELRVVGSRQ